MKYSLAGVLVVYTPSLTLCPLLPLGASALLLLPGQFSEMQIFNDSLRSTLKRNPSVAGLHGLLLGEGAPCKIADWLPMQLVT